MLLVGLVASGVATAEVRTGAPAPRLAQAVADVVSSLSTDSTSSTSSSDSTSSTSTDSTSSSSRTSGVLSVLSSLSTASTSTSSTSTSSTSTSSTSDDTYTITFPPTPGPTHGDGHRYYGRYWDAALNCWRYASPNYVPQTVVATQVASVPKGGVNTGDGSFR
jgi:hypothetical protein